MEAARKVLGDTKGRVAAEATQLDSEVQRLLRELETTERDLPADVRDLYDRAIKNKGEEGLAPLDGESCGGCFRQITGNMYSELLVGKVVMCRSCGRLLYLPEKTASD